MANRMSAKLEATAAKRMLRRLADSGKDLTPAMTSIGRSFKTRSQLTFRTSTDPYGKPWAPITHRKGQPLRDTGRLYRSITYHAESKSVVVGTNVDYAPTHQFGYSGSVTVPKHVRMINKAFGKALPQSIAVSVKSHLRQMNIHARPYLPLDGLPRNWALGVKRQVIRHLTATAVDQ